MKMAMKDGVLYIKDMDSVQKQIIKSWNKMTWNRSAMMYIGPAEQELLNKLAGLVRLPEPIEKERKRLNQISNAVDAERMNDNPVPMYKYPVKMNLYQHQVRGANMAMMTFELIPPERKEVGDG